MRASLYDITTKLRTLQQKESRLQDEMKKGVTSQAGMSKVQSRIMQEHKLRELRKEIEQEEYELYEARILQSLSSR